MSEDFKVGDRVRVKGTDRVGVIVEYPVHRVQWDPQEAGTYYQGDLELVPPEPPSLIEAAEALIELMEAAAGRTLTRPEVLAVKSALDREKAKQRELERSHMVDTKGRL